MQQQLQCRAMWIKNNNNFPARGLSTPPPTWKSRPFLHSPLSERKHRSPSSVKPDPFHVLHKVPAGDSPYVKAKHVQLIDKDPSKAISLIWGAINSGDRVDSALKDMAVVMKQLNRSEEAIEAIKSFRHLCPYESQDSLDNLLVELYKKAGRVEEEIEMLQLKLKRIEESSMAFGGRKMKTARSQGKKIHITVDQERSRILGNLAWAYMQQNNYNSAEEVYRKALTLEADYNKQCNLAICLMHMNKIGEAKSLLQGVIRPSSCKDGNRDDDSYARSFERAFQMLAEIDSSSVPTTSLHDDQQGKDNNKNQRSFTSPINGISKELASSTSECRGYGRSPEGNGIPEAAYISHFPVRAIPKAPLSEPRRGSWFFNKGDDQRRRGGLWRDDAVGVYSSHKCMESQTADNVRSKTFAHGYEKNSSDVTVSDGSKGVKDVTENSSSSHCRKMSWADMVEEDERELASERNVRVETKWSVDPWEAREGYYDENLNSNITFPLEQMVDNLSIKNESNELKDGYCIKSGNGMISSTVRRSLCFDLQPNAADPVEFLCSSSPLPEKALNFEGGDSFAPADGKNIKPPMRRNRLQVFKNITLLPESP